MLGLLFYPFHITKRCENKGGHQRDKNSRGSSIDVLCNYIRTYFTAAPDVYKENVDVVLNIVENRSQD